MEHESVNEQYHLESVERVVRVLNCFLEEPELRLTDLSARLGLHKTQVLRIVSTLEAAGFLARDPATKQYRLGLQIFRLGMAMREQLDLRRVAHPVLERLGRETGETVRLVVPDEDAAVCIDVIDSPQGLRVYAQIGARMPWNAGTSAKVVLAYLPDEDRERILAAGGFKQLTPRTIVDPDELRADVLAIRRRGYHINIGDLQPDTRGVAAPIFNDRGELVASISISAPASRLQEPKSDHYIQTIVSAAREISTQLGYLPGAEPPAAAARSTQGAGVADRD